MLYALSQVSAPATEPVTLAEAQAHVRVDHNQENTLLSSLITAARQWCELRCNSSFVTQTWDLILPCFPGRVLYLPRSPVSSLTSITYYDSANASTSMTLADYVVQLLSAKPAELHLKSGVSWPSTYERPDAVTIRYVAGYGAASAVPQPIKQAMLLLIADMFDQRGTVIVGTVSSDVSLTVERLLSPYRIFSPR